MRNGDLSNDMPKRVLVSLEPLVITHTETTKKYVVFKQTKKHIEYDSLLLNKLFLFASRNDINLELFSFNHTIDELDLIIAEIDRAGLNPFRYHSVYKNAKHLASKLPYRPEVLGVIDIEENRLFYGHWALDF